MLVNENNSMPYMKSLSTCLNRITTEGYAEDFKIGERGLEALQHGRIYEPGEINIVNFFRFEGESDPADNAILYVIETSDGIKGTLIDSYGLYNDSMLSRFMSQVDSIHKKTTRN